MKANRFKSSVEVNKFIFLMLRDIAELKIQMLMLRAIILVGFSYNLATINATYSLIRMKLR